jgi:hypothetical protein
MSLQSVLTVRDWNKTKPLLPGTPYFPALLPHKTILLPTKAKTTIPQNGYTYSRFVYYLFLFRSKGIEEKE